MHAWGEGASRYIEAGRTAGSCDCATEKRTVFCVVGLFVGYPKCSVSCGDGVAVGELENKKTRPRGWRREA